MIDIKLLQKDFESVAEKLKRRFVDETLIESAREISLQMKRRRQEMEGFQAEQNAKSKLFGQYKKEGKDISELKKEVDGYKAKISVLQDEVRFFEEKLESLALSIPNLPDDSLPVGEDESGNVEIKKVLTPKTFDFTPKEHWELAESNHWIDFERGVKLAGSRFSVLKGMGAQLSRAMISYMVDFNRSRGFEEVQTPVLVNPNMLRGTGQLPKFEDDLYKIEGEDFYLIPTAEVTLTNLYHDEIIPVDELPFKMTGYTPCFRKEAGSGGRDLRGIIRQHQFDKVELVAITTPEQSEGVQQEMIQCASDLLESLNLPHRLMRLCTGDMGFSAANTVDIEVWLPGQNAYREISSVSNTRDFQARRAKIRFKDGKKNLPVHTLNGSSLAVGRTLIALMENNQDKDGNIAIPEVLKPYLK